MNFAIVNTMTIAALVAGAVEGGTVYANSYGTKADGITDDSVAIQKALDTAEKNGGGVVQLGVGKYRIDKPINVPQGVTLAGVWEAPHHSELSKGTVFAIYAGKGKENDPPAVLLNQSSAVKGITFFYPEQRLPDPIPYPYTVQGKDMHGSIIDCTFVNPYMAIDFGKYKNELHYIRNCYGCPLKVGIHIDKCTDIGRIENVHFNPHYWVRTCSESVPDWNTLIKYIGENLVGFEFARTDWEYVHNTFVFGAKIGYRFYGTDSGSVNGNFLGIGADWCGRALSVEHSQLAGLLITNGEFVGHNNTDIFMEVMPTHVGLVQLSNCSFWGPAASVAKIDGKGTVSFNQCAFLNQGDASDVFTIDAISGDVNISNCRFGVNRPDIRLRKDITTAVISGNQFQGAKHITNESAGDVQEGLNVVKK